MKFRALVLIIAAFCLTILSQINRKIEVATSQATQPNEHFEGPAEFIKFHRAIRTPVDANTPEYKPGFIIKEFQKAQATSANARTQSNGVIAWKERGPANVPGRTRGLLVDPGDPNKNTWFAGSVGGGVWKTTNGGVSWTLTTPDLPNLATTVLAMATSNPNVIYIGTGEGFGNVDGVQGNGMYKSINRGQTWSYLSSTSNFDDVNRVIIDPTNENIVLAASNSGIYKTIDGGTTWTKVSTRSPIQDLDATPGNFSIQYASQNGVGVLKSTDGGSTWNLANTAMGTVNRVEVAISPVKPTRIFASCESGATSKLLMSDDSAVTWSIVNVRLTTTDLDFLNGQGWYGNILACDPFNADIIYLGGVDLFQLKLDGGSSTTNFYTLEEATTQSFISLTSFTNATNGNFDVGTSAGNVNVEIRFGPGKSQKAHRFLVPAGLGAGVAATSFTYQDYVTVPFEVWDVTNNKQLMASFRDQGRDGVFNLINNNTDNADATLQSREYLYVNNVAYNETTASTSIAIAGGHEFNKMYFVWPILPAGGIWPPTTAGTLRFKVDAQLKLNATTQFITDARGGYGNANKNKIVHPDHHNLVMIPMSATTYKILNANDGGVFISNESTTPGITDGTWNFAGGSYNTGQLYGADKRPGQEEYFGGMQDNGTWKSPAGAVANPNTNYVINIGGDGFEVIWNYYDDKKLIGGSQGNGFRRSIDGGLTWSNAISGLSGTHPFISKLASSQDNPETLFTLSSAGVFRSIDFGATWVLTPITDKWGGANTFLDVEVSRANANIIWAGSGMVNSGTQRNLFVSTNGGLSFIPTVNYTEQTMGTFTKLASHPSQQKTAYALFSFAGRPKILRTTDLGQTWNDISGFGASTASNNGFPDVAVYCLYVRTDDPSIIWAGTEIGIVESLNNGVSWSLLSDFPKVSVWDMKGVDDQIVIATHGRGIWTAQLNAVQKNSIVKPSVLAIGTTPQSNLSIKILLPDNYDSTQVFVNSQKVGKINKLPIGEYIIKVKNAPIGNNEVKLVGYLNSAPYYSVIFTGKKLDLKVPYQNQYANLFTTADDFLRTNFTLSDFGTSNQSLQSIHPYAANSEAIALLLQPIIVSATNSNFIYQDVALVQPSATGVTFGQAAFKDYIVVEGTKDGLTWIPLKDGYNASANSQWLNAYNINFATGTPAISIQQTIDLKSKFAANDTLLFRFRIKADADDITGWGWSIDNLYIQLAPVGLETETQLTNFSVFPNPTNGKVKIQFELAEATPVSIEAIDIKGAIIKQFPAEPYQSGHYSKEIDLTNEASGIYLIKLTTSTGKKISKVHLIK